MKLKKIEFELNMMDMKRKPFKKKVQGYAIPEVEGLGIHKEKFHSEVWWYVTHIESGNKVHSDYFDTRKQAGKYCELLGEIKNNGFWTKSGEELQNVISGDERFRKEVLQAQILAKAI